MNIPKLEDIEKELEKRRLQSSLIHYTQWSFKKKTGKNFLVNSHHLKITEALERVARGECTRLIINISPRYGKTEIAVKSFIEWSFANNPRCKFIHLSYSDALALDNSSSIRDSIKSDWYQDLWPIDIKRDSDAKQKWFNSVGGGLYATGTEGSITGFGAGSTESSIFAGCVIIDDPSKPSESMSDTVRNKINDRLNNTILSRLNNPRETPIIIIMQRLHDEDMTGFCLNGGTGEKWEHLKLPVIDDNGEALWPHKHTLAQLEVMQKANPSVFASQYMQTPVTGSGNMFKKENFKECESLPEFDYIFITADTAYKEKQHNDYTVFAVWGVYQKNIYLIEIYRERIKSSECERVAIDLINRHDCYVFRGCYIEPKGHGIYLNQKLPALGLNVPSEQQLKEFYDDRNKSKVERANNAIPHLNSRYVFFGPNIINSFELVHEAISFPYGTHDDFVDVLIDAIKFVCNQKLSTLDLL